MADYGGLGGGNSLRDALNALYPMRGMGEYNTMFPPQTGAPQPSGPVPMPPPRPQMPPQLPPGLMGMAPPGMGGQPPGLPPGGPPGLAQAPGLQGQLGLGGGIGRPGLPGGPQISGGVNVPLGPNTQAFAGGRFGGGQDYAAQLGLRRQF